MNSRKFNLKAFNTFGIDVDAKLFFKFSTLDELNILLTKFHEQEILILGGGSNILFTQNVNQIVLKNELKGIEIISKDNQNVLLKVGAGEVWHEFVEFCLRHNFGGVENLALIPGNVGASPMQNIGAYGVEVKDVIEKVEALEIKTQKLHYFTNEKCKFGYRESIFKREMKNKFVITNVFFKLKINPEINATYGAIQKELEIKGVTNPTIKDISNVVISIRKSKLPDPKFIGNAGSFFKNPIINQKLYDKLKIQFQDIPFYNVSFGFVKIPAAWLIEQAGWKGKTFGNYGVHKNQALVLVNYGGATGQEIWNLSSQIVEDVKNKFEIELEREVNVY
jgi:UDP-N-acetylmuramate dehydrogenase